jgi:hypothetical protein
MMRTKLLYLISVLNTNFKNLYGEDFISYGKIKEELKTNKYAGVLIKIGSSTCPPCKALDKGPLDNLNRMVNEKLPKNKKLLIINFSLDKGNNKDDFMTLLNTLGIKVPNSIPALFLFKYNPTNKNLLELKYETLGYDMWNPNKWLNEMVNVIINHLK